MYNLTDLFHYFFLSFRAQVLSDPRAYFYVHYVCPQYTADCVLKTS